MKNVLSLLVLVFSVMLTGCAVRKAPPNSSPFEPVPSNSSGDSPVPEVATTLPNNPNPQADPGDTAKVSVSSSEIILSDDGKTFTYHVGDSFLLHLGADIYEWEVTVDDQNIIKMKMGMMVIQGAQGIYDALAPGSTTLTAVGTPRCLKSSPPCGMPTLRFRVTLVVE